MLVTAALVLFFSAFAAALGPWGQTAKWADLRPILRGSAITFPERAGVWLDGLVGIPEDAHPDVMMALLEGLLTEDPERSTRSAVLLGAILGRDDMPGGLRSAAGKSLVHRLESRVDLGARWKVGADVAAARALDRPWGSGDAQSSAREALLELAHGQVPHPNLAVRVECAASALKLTTDRATQSTAPTTDFLLAVLRAETPAQAQSPRTWPRITTLAWVKTRASEALSKLTGLENRFRPDGPWAHQVAEAARFESQLP